MYGIGLGFSITNTSDYVTAAFISSYEIQNYPTRH